MKLLNLFSTGTAGTTGTSLQGQGFCPSRLGIRKTGQRDENTGTGGGDSLSRPVRPGTDFTTGTAENVDTVTPSRSSRSSHSEIEQNISDAPTPAQLAHARSLITFCPSTGGKLHCWHCTRCAKEMKCMAWRHILAAEMRFQRSAAGKTLSVELAEHLLMEAGNE